MRIRPMRFITKQTATDFLVLAMLLYFLVIDILETRPLPYWGWQGY